MKKNKRKLTTKDIAKDMEKWFKKEGIRCEKCKKGSLKCSTFFIDNVEIEPVMIECRKCGYTFLEPESAKVAINQVKTAYEGNPKITRDIIFTLKRRMNKGWYDKN